MKYSVVIPTYNHCDDLLKPCIETLLKYSIVSDVELIVSANGCNDNTKSYLDDLQEKYNYLGLPNNLKVVFNDEPLGYSKACNEGIKLATCDYIVLLNNDVIFLEQTKNQWLDILEHQFNINSKCGISCVVKQFSPAAGRDFAVFFLVMIHKKVFDTIGLLNIEYGVGSGEDTEFCIEAERAGFQVCESLSKEYTKEFYVGQFPIYHKGEGTVHDTNLIPDYHDIFYRNSLILAKKYNPIWYEQQIANNPKSIAETMIPKKEILCSISTRGRYDTTLPLTLISVINQTKKPDKLVIFDDNDQPKDLREVQHYMYIFQLLDIKGIQWEFVFAERKGQHYNHQRANSMGYKWVWRLDDDTIAEPNVLETLYSHVNDEVGAVGGSILTPPHTSSINSTGLIENINEPSIQWGTITQKKEVDHLHCSFLYRAGITDYCLSLSRVAHREETLFTYELKLKGYKNYVVPDAITWHLKNKDGGIRDGVQEMYLHDDKIFNAKMKLKDHTIVVLDCGMGDHVMFKQILPEIKNPLIFTCYPEIVPGKSISEAHEMLGDISQYNIYAKMDQWKWKDTVTEAFRKMYIK